MLKVEIICKQVDIIKFWIQDYFMLFFLFVCLFVCFVFWVFCCCCFVLFCFVLFFVCLFFFLFFLNCHNSIGSVCKINACISESYNSDV